MRAFAFSRFESPASNLGALKTKRSVAVTSTLGLSSLTGNKQGICERCRSASCDRGCCHVCPALFCACARVPSCLCFFFFFTFPPRSSCRIGECLCVCACVCLCVHELTEGWSSSVKCVMLGRGKWFSSQDSTYQSEFSSSD